MRNALTIVWCRFWSWSLVSILLLLFGWDYEVELFEIQKLGLVKILKLQFSQGADVWLRFWSWCMVKTWRGNLIKICVRTTQLVLPLAIFYQIKSCSFPPSPKEWLRVTCNGKFPLEMDGWMDGWMDCWTDESLDEKMNKWISEYDLMNELKTDQTLMHKIWFDHPANFRDVVDRHSFADWLVCKKKSCSTSRQGNWLTSQEITRTRIVTFRNKISYSSWR